MIQINVTKCPIKRDQVNFVGLWARPISKNKKNDIMKFWQTGSFFKFTIFCFLKKKEGNKT